MTEQIFWRKVIQEIEKIHSYFGSIIVYYRVFKRLSFTKRYEDTKLQRNPAQDSYYKTEKQTNKQKQQHKSTK